jgi:hypothetical protein
MPPTILREIFLDHGRVQIDLPRLMTDDQLAEVLESFVKDVKGRGTKELKASHRRSRSHPPSQSER